MIERREREERERKKGRRSYICREGGRDKRDRERLRERVKGKSS